jgi:sugar O-acyltransferase (sialic acid O-acetyltransferase NeuD family)
VSKVVIFGIKDLAELAHWYLQNDSPHEIVAFTVNEEYLEGREFCGLPVTPFEKLLDNYPPDGFQLFAPMTQTKMNQSREAVFNDGKQKGYEFISYVSSKATVCGNSIGENCFILEDNTLQPFTKIGNNVVLWSGNHIGHHGQINDHVFFTSHVVMSGHCKIGSHSFLGVNATIRDGCTLGEGTLLAMGASLTKQSTEPWSVYVGNPAKKLEKKSSLDIF